MFRLSKFISSTLILLVLFKSTNIAFASQYSGSLYAYSSKNTTFINDTKNFISADEKGFISIDSLNNSDSSKNTSNQTQSAKLGDVKSTINKESKYKFQCGLAAVIVKNKVGYISTNGKLVIQAIYDDGTMFYEDAAFVRRGKKWALIDKTGKLLTKYIFDDVDYTNCLYKDIVINDYHGLLNSEGELVIPPIYSGALDVESDNSISLSTYDSLKKMLVENQIGSINTDGEASYNSSYTPFSSLTNNGILSALDKYTSKRQFPSYDKVWSLGNGLYCGYKAASNSYFVFDRTGKQVYTSK
ncbi:MAG: repeat-containing protein [Clostridiales bacterium]|jgi:hypothetical protein|nr:repeat-containing protein [Clostridiales bacterium]